MSESRMPGPILIGVEGTELNAKERTWLQHPGVGGVVLFTRNFSGRDQVRELNESIREAAVAPMLICVDHEGGRVQRFREGFTRLPPLAILGRMHADAPDMACDFAYRHGRVMATEVLLCDIDLSFAPVLDLDVESCVIGDRSFSASADAVIDLGKHYLAGMHDAGMKTCGKHFPGHGSVLADSHVDDVVDDRSLREIRNSDLKPFEALLGDLDSLMMAHVIYPAYDQHPAGYSARWTREFLRDELEYSGVIFSDDLGMHAAHYAGKLSARMQLSLDAGCHAVLVCQPADVEQLLIEIGEATPGDCPELLSLAGRNTISDDELASVGEWRHWQESVEQLEHSKWA